MSYVLKRMFSSKVKMFQISPLFAGRMIEMTPLLPQIAGGTSIEIDQSLNMPFPAVSPGFWSRQGWAEDLYTI